MRWHLKHLLFNRIDIIEFEHNFMARISLEIYTLLRNKYPIRVCLGRVEKSHSIKCFFHSIAR